MVVIYARCNRSTSSPTDWTIMRRFFTFVFLAAVAVGVVWYENQPTTVKIPIETDQVEFYQPDYTAETTTSEAVETTEPQGPEVSFDVPDVTFEMEQSTGDSVRLQEVIGEPQRLDSLPEEVETALRSCQYVTDRDLVIRIDAKIELTSALPLELDLDYNTQGNPAVFEFSSGPVCSEGKVNHGLKPDTYNHLTYWVALRGVITPDNPDGDLSKTWTLVAPEVGWYSLQPSNWKLWGPRVSACGTMWSNQNQVWLAGPSPVGSRGCEPATTLETAAHNS